MIPCLDYSATKIFPAYQMPGPGDYCCRVGRFLSSIMGKSPRLLTGPPIVMGAGLLVPE
jgi:hypothetical protein